MIKDNEEFIHDKPQVIENFSFNFVIQIEIDTQNIATNKNIIKTKC